MIIVYASAIAAAILSLVWGVTAKPSAARANLMAGLEPLQPPTGSKLTESTRRLGQTTRRLLPASYIKSLDTNLVQAAHPWKLDMARLLGIKLALALAPFLVGIVVGQPIWGFLVGVGMFFLPDYLVMTQRDARTAAIQEATADTIDQLTICVEAGLGFDAALMRVAHTTEGPLATELERTVEDMRAGVPRDQALRAFADRTRLSEMKQLVSALIQAQKHGVTIAETLRIQSADLRDRRTQAVEEKAAKLATKVLFPMIFCFLPVFFVILIVPSAAETLTSIF